MEHNRALLRIHLKYIEKIDFPPIIREAYKKYITSQFHDLGVLYLRYMACFKDSISKEDLKIALGIELFKTFGHIIDDIVDNDLVREGKASFYSLLIKEKIGENESKAISIHIGFLLESLANKIFAEHHLHEVYTFVKERTLLGQIDEELLKNKTDYAKLYLKKTFFTSFPLQLACKTNNVLLPKRMLNDLIVADQKIDDIYDLLYKGTHLRNDNNTYLRARFKDSLKSPSFIQDNKEALLAITYGALTELNNLQEFLLTASARPNKVSEAIDPQRGYIHSLKEEIEAR